MFQGCPAENITSWLTEISHLPEARSTSSYWILKARLAEPTSTPQQILDIYEQASRCQAKVRIVRRHYVFPGKL